MGLHRLASLVVGVPNVDETARYYEDFGLAALGDNRFATVDGGEQLRLVRTPTRRLVEMRIGADSADDVAAVASRLDRLGIPTQHDGERLTATEPVCGMRVIVQRQPRVTQPAVAAASYNGPGRPERVDARAATVLSERPVRPHKLGHVVVGSTDFVATQRFFTDGIGFKVSDAIKDAGTFLRCSTDHHNLLVLNAPVSFLHHTSWQVQDVDEVGRGAMRMLDGHPERHVWGLGRHHAGSNFFWYLKDPAGNFSEYYSDLDCIVSDQVWTPEVFEGAKGLFSWGPPPPPSFLEPEDLGALMTGVHAPN